MNNENVIIEYEKSRWARFGPYYAMFPMDFAYDVINKYSKKETYVLDPFCGRGSSLYAAASLGRIAHGIEINPVGWLYSKVKLHPASIKSINNRLCDVINNTKDITINKNDFPEFFSYCFCDDVIKFLLSMQEMLDWKNNNVDATLMAFTLHYLHGKKGQSLSNQMPMVKAMSPQYSINWWNKNNCSIPPLIDIKEFFIQRIQWRYKKGYAKFKTSKSLHGNSIEKLHELKKYMDKKGKKYSLLFTSPPYHGVTNYFSDQWLRCWMLGEPNQPKINVDKYKKRFYSENAYIELLDKVFSMCKQMLENNAILYIRTDSREFTLNTTKKILLKYFPNHALTEQTSQCNVISQTELYKNSNKKPCEVDIILEPK
ncbi:MAG: hypothetical protein FWE90_05115 [Defluviitaleaceae bacterium]|nr:hypothetical protein [Defluviitaleaceae bacterium]